MKNGKIKVGIVGGAGYTAGELIRILVNHPCVELSFVHSESNAGNMLSDVHEGLVGDTDQTFCSEYDLSTIDVLFLCGAHGKSAEFWQQNSLPEGLKVIDLAQDYRDQSNGYVYGLPEWQKSKVATACKLANPGCFATAIQLALLPLANAGLLDGEVQVTAITGSTGAGVKPGATTHFSWRNNNISTYKVLEHQHLLEINRNLAELLSLSASAGTASLQARPSQSATGPLPLEPRAASLPERYCPSPADGAARLEVESAQPHRPGAERYCPSPADGAFQINFVPVRGDFARGIFASVYTKCDLTEEEAVKLYRDYYAGAAFTFVYGKPVDLKQVVNTNKCLVHVEKHGDQLVISSVIDNLLKGASGQAVQNMNLMFGLDERTGLNLKASAF